MGPPLVSHLNTFRFYAIQHLVACIQLKRKACKMIVPHFTGLRRDLEEELASTKEAKQERHSRTRLGIDGTEPCSTNSCAQVPEDSVCCSGRDLLSVNTNVEPVIFLVDFFSSITQLFFEIT